MAVNPGARRAFAVALFFALSAALGFGHGQGRSAGVGIEERLGAYVPLDIRFFGEDGAPVSLRELVRTPTILSMVYYRCANVCDVLVMSIADVLRSLPGEPGRDFVVLTISVNDREIPADARKAKRIGLESIQKPFPGAAWRFLTGEDASIDAVADAIGYRFVQNGDDIDHPLGLVVLSPQGKIVRYMNGTSFLPADLRMSLLEASTGTIGPTISRVLRFCFRVDPASHTLVFNSLKVTATVTLLLALGLVLYLVVSGRKRRAKGKV
jgi:protein SCO1/2